jgi:SAM-dependent methyltransferase
MSEAKNYFRWQYNLVEPYLGQRILEIGCGIGNFTEFMKRADRHILGIDIDGNCVTAHNERFADAPEIEAKQLDVLGRGASEARAFQPDTIVCLNVLEHIADDAAVLRSMWHILEPRGRVCFIVPAFEALRGPIDDLLGHYRRYTLGGFRTLATSAGFQIERACYMNLVGLVGWWMNAKVLRRRAQSRSQVAVFDQMIVPIASQMERLITPPVGQNVFAILRKAAQ